MVMGINPRTITAANSIVQMKAEGYYDQYQIIQGYQADNAFNFGDAAIGEVRVGVDNQMSGGYTPHSISFTIQLEANSPSRDLFENLRADFNSNQETRKMSFMVSLPSLGKKYTAEGFMTSMTGGSSAQRLLAGSSYTFQLMVTSQDDL